MKTLLTIIISMTFLVAQAQKVTEDIDKTVDFSKYSSFQFLGWQDDSDQVMSKFDRDRMQDAFKSEFDARNLKMVDSGADMAISLFVVVDQKTSTTAYTNYSGGMGYGRGGRGWGGGYASTNYVETDYLQGTLVMDVYDVESKKLIWQAVATGTVSEKPKKREKGIPKSVKKLMKKFPIEKVK